MVVKFLRKNRYITVIFTILIAIEIFYFSSIPGTVNVSGGINWMLTLYHFIVFFLFSFFLLISIKGDKKLKLNHLLIVLTLSIAYAILDEVHQVYTPFRDPSIRDILTDVIGIFSATTLYFFTFNKVNHIKNSKPRIKDRTRKGKKKEN